MRIVAISDLHGHLPRIPPCDLLLIAEVLRPLAATNAEVEKGWLMRNFTRWLEAVPARSIVGISGNHDFIAARAPELMRRLPWTYLCNETVDVAGLRVFGSPAAFGEWPFILPENELAQVWAAIPADVDVVLVHGPPYGCGDEPAAGVHAGSRSLLARLEQVPQLRLAVFGHVHKAAGFGRLEGGALWVNASAVTVAFELRRRPYVEIELEAEPRVIDRSP